MIARELHFFFTPEVYLAMLGLYFLSLVLFYVDFLRDSRMASRSGLLLLALVWVLETGYLGARIAIDHAIPFFSSSQASLFFAWLLITVSFAVSALSRIDYFTFFINLLGFLFVALDTLVRGRAPDALTRMSDLLLLHISLAFLSYVAFTLSCIFSVLYLMGDSALRMKRFGSGPFKRLPPLQVLDVFAFRSALVGGPLLLIAMILGAVWYAVLTGHVLLFDAKPIASTLLFCVYLAYLWLRARGTISGRKAAWWNVVAFIGVLLNDLVFGEYMSKFHRW